MGVHPWADSLRWVSSDQPRTRARQAVRVSAVLLLEHVARHSRAFRRRVRPRGSRVAVQPLQLDLGCSTSVCRASRYLRRREVLTTVYATRTSLGVDSRWDTASIAELNVTSLRTPGAATMSPTT